MAEQETDRSVDVGGEVKGSAVVTGDHNSVLVLTIQAIQRHWLIAVIVLLVSIGAAVGIVIWRQHQAIAQRETVKQIQQRYAERFLENLTRDKDLPVEDARQQALAELPKLIDLSPDEIQRIIDDHIAELANDVNATPLERARAKLTVADYDGVLAEEEKQRTEIREMAMLAGTAALAKFREQPLPKWHEQAAAAFQRALALSDAETEPLARADAGLRAAFVLEDLARYDEAEGLLREAWKLRESILGPNDKEVAVVLNNLAGVLLATNRLAEAEVLLRRAMRIDERLYGAEHPDVARDLNNLAQLLKATNRLAEAEPLMRRALAIWKKSLGARHSQVATGLNNLAQLLSAKAEGAAEELDPKSRAALLVEAESLMRLALAIDEQSFGEQHPRVARDLNNLAQLLYRSNRMTEAEPLFRRALKIDQQSLGKEHPYVAIDLNNLAQLLKATNRLKEAEPLIRRALDIDKKYHGAEHPNVAVRLNNLAQLLQDTDRRDEAEPLLRRALEILVNFSHTTGHEHPHLRPAVSNYANLLREMGLDEAEIERRFVEMGFVKRTESGD